MRITPIHIVLNNDYTISIEFSNGEQALFDAKPFLDKGAFKELRKIEKFRTAKIVDGAVQWSNSVDLSPDTLYCLAVKTQQYEENFVQA